MDAIHCITGILITIIGGFMVASSWRDAMVSRRLGSSWRSVLPRILSDACIWFPVSAFGLHLVAHGVGLVS